MCLNFRLYQNKACIPVSLQLYARATSGLWTNKYILGESPRWESRQKKKATGNVVKTRILAQWIDLLSWGRDGAGLCRASAVTQLRGTWGPRKERVFHSCCTPEMLCLDQAQLLSRQAGMWTAGIAAWCINGDCTQQTVPGAQMDWGSRQGTEQMHIMNNTGFDRALQAKSSTE